MEKVFDFFVNDEFQMSFTPFNQVKVEETFFEVIEKLEELAAFHGDNVTAFKRGSLQHPEKIKNQLEKII